MEELVGDRILSLALLRLFKKWRLSKSWALTLHELITSNDNWKRLASCWDLPDLSRALEDLKNFDVSDAFEVIPFIFLWTCTLDD